MWSTKSASVFGRKNKTKKKAKAPFRPALCAPTAHPPASPCGPLLLTAPLLRAHLAPDPLALMHISTTAADAARPLGRNDTTFSLRDHPSSAVSDVRRRARDASRDRCAPLYPAECLGATGCLELYLIDLCSSSGCNAPGRYVRVEEPRQGRLCNLCSISLYVRVPNGAHSL